MFFLKRESRVMKILVEKKNGVPEALCIPAIKDRVSAHKEKFLTSHFA